MRPALDNDLSGPFWQAAEQGRLVMTWCDACEQGVWYPQPRCPDCGGGLVWKTLGGRASLLAWTVVRGPVNAAFAAPYVPALVVPEEAPRSRLVTCIVGCSPSELYCDMALQVRFQQLETIGGERYAAPVFAPAIHAIAIRSP